MQTSHYLPTLKCCIVGSCGVGKTSIIQKHLKKNNKNTETTLGAIFWTIMQKNETGIPYKIDFWDTAGQERYNSLIPMYSRNSDIMIITFDLSDRRTFLDVEKWLHTLTQNNKNGKFILIGNKCDMELYRQVYEGDVKKFLNKHRELEIKYIETSAREGTNIDELFQIIFDYGNQKIKKVSVSGRMVSINLNDEKIDSLDKEKYNCCTLL